MPKQAPPPLPNFQFSNSSEADSYFLESRQPHSLVVVFTNIYGKMMGPIQTFLRSTLTRAFDVYILYDRSKLLFVNGLASLGGGLDGLVEEIKAKAGQKDYRHVICTGHSSGSYAAMLYGHLADIDFVHAFSPFTFLNMENVEQYQDPALQSQQRTLQKLQEVPGKIQDYLDLKQVLANPGKTRYYLHYAKNNSFERNRTCHIHGVPNTWLIGYNTGQHFLLPALSRVQRLPHLFHPRVQAGFPAFLKKETETLLYQQDVPEIIGPDDPLPELAENTPDADSPDADSSAEESQE